MLILKALSLGPLYGYGIIQRIRQLSSARPGHCESQKSSLRRLMMEWFNILMAWLLALYRRESVSRDIEEVLRVHVEMETETNIKRGMPPDEARASALKNFGSSV
jgi:hypothetical protein